MGDHWEHESLLQPITTDQPCGESVEDTPLLASFDVLRVFGQKSRSPDAPPAPDESRKPPEWPEVRTAALNALSKTKDLRLLAYLGAALLRTDGMPAFFETLHVASRWLETYWAQVYPLIDEDAIARLNALNCFADPMAIVERLRRTPLVTSLQHGTFSLRDVDLATGQIPSGNGDVKPEEGPIDAAFGEMPLDQLSALQQQVADAMAALNSIDVKMRTEIGPDVAPGFDLLSVQLVKMNRLLRAQLASRPDGAAARGDETLGEPGAGALGTVGPIKSRQDAVRALEAVADFFRRTEPSSPVPLLVDRAKRLVAKDFLEVLADIAPDALGVARAAGGLKDGA